MIDSSDQDAAKDYFGYLSLMLAAKCDLAVSRLRMLALGLDIKVPLPANPDRVLDSAGDFARGTFTSLEDYVKGGRFSSDDFDPSYFAIPIAYADGSIVTADKRIYEYYKDMYHIRLVKKPVMVELLQAEIDLWGVKAPQQVRAMYTEHSPYTPDDDDGYGALNHSAREPLKDMALKYKFLNTPYPDELFPGGINEDGFSVWSLYQTWSKNLSALNHTIERLQDPATRNNEIVALEHAPKSQARENPSVS